MLLEGFVERLQEAGWRSTADAQHAGIEEMWRELFPVVAQLSDELDDAHNDFLTACEAKPND